ncbi:MAG: type II toxin-antitoxin system PemK/MazF family toxin [Trueperaceae bacterium]|nr:type II toxin-antitoxin system PemK/MazF family toxin [Trueperaceae bacterium]
MTRGDIVWVDLGEPLGSEADKSRPCVVVSNDVHNRLAPTVTVVPITSNVSRILAVDVYLESLLGRPSKVQVNQVRTVSKSRVRGKAVARLDTATAVRVDDALRLHLAL